MNEILFPFSNPSTIWISLLLSVIVFLVPPTKVEFSISITCLTVATTLHDTSSLFFKEIFNTQLLAKDALSMLPSTTYLS